MKKWLILVVIIITGVSIVGLHDIDKSSDNRGVPKPNANDQKSEYLAQGTTQTQNSGAEATADGLKIKERQILAVQDGFEKAAFGFYGAAGKFGFKVAEDGYDATTASDDNLIFNSEQNVFKIVKKGTANLPSFVSTTGYSAIKIPHGQSSTPIVAVYVRGYLVDSSIAISSSSYVPIPIMMNMEPSAPLAANYYFPDVAGSSYRPLGIIFGVDSTNITIQAGCDTSLGASTFASVPITYFVLQETAN